MSQLKSEGALGICLEGCRDTSGCTVASLHGVLIRGLVGNSGGVFTLCLGDIKVRGQQSAQGESAAAEAGAVSC